MPRILLAMVMGSAIGLSMIILPAHAQSWKQLYLDGNSTYIGGYYAATSYACLGTNYTNDSGVWRSGEAMKPYRRGCAAAVFKAMFGDILLPEDG